MSLIPIGVDGYNETSGEDIVNRRNDRHLNGALNHHLSCPAQMNGNADLQVEAARCWMEIGNTAGIEREVKILRKAFKNKQEGNPLVEFQNMQK